MTFNWVAAGLVTAGFWGLGVQAQRRNEASCATGGGVTGVSDRSVGDGFTADFMASTYRSCWSCKDHVGRHGQPCDEALSGKLPEPDGAGKNGDRRDACELVRCSGVH